MFKLINLTGGKPTAGYSNSTLLWSMFFYRIYRIKQSLTRFLKNNRILEDPVMYRVTVQASSILRL